MTRPHRGALIAAETLLGIGLGGFVDGVVSVAPRARDSELSGSMA